MVLGNRNDGNWDEPTDTESVKVAQNTANIPSIAVLPSVNMGDAEDYVSDRVATDREGSILLNNSAFADPLIAPWVTPPEIYAAPAVSISRSNQSLDYL